MCIDVQCWRTNVGGRGVRTRCSCWRVHHGGRLAVNSFKCHNRLVLRPAASQGSSRYPTCITAHVWALQVAYKPTLCIIRQKNDRSVFGLMSVSFYVCVHLSVCPSLFYTIFMWTHFLCIHWSCLYNKWIEMATKRFTSLTNTSRGLSRRSRGIYIYLFIYIYIYLFFFYFFLFILKINIYIIFFYFFYIYNKKYIYIFFLLFFIIYIFIYK